MVVKPCRRSQGEGVAVVHSRQEVTEAARAIFQHDRVLLVQQWCPGRDYRIVVLDGEAISAYERVPLTVTGDGRSSVAQLLQQLQREFDAAGRDTRLPLDDPRIPRQLRRLGRSLKQVPFAGESLRLLDVANLSLGGTTVEITERLHPSFARLAARIASDMDLRFAGVDLIAPDATRPLKDYAVLEINSAPGLDHYGASGPAHQAAIDELYFKVLQAVAQRPR